MQQQSKTGLFAKMAAGAAFMGLPLSAMAAAMMPFIMGSTPSGDLSAATSSTESALSSAGFEVVGKYSPIDGTNVIVVTNDALKSLAGNSKNGGFGAMQRVAVTSDAGTVQVSYTNPEYHFNAYRMKGDITGVQTAMEKALGNIKQFGAKKGIEADDLREYHYMFAMPYFDDEDELAEYGSYAEAVKAVEVGLAANRGGAQKVYRIDIPGKEMTVFGVALKYKDAADGNIAQKLKKETSHNAHFPYEILVSGDEVMALNGKFRIAINWPSLSMTGDGSFMSIMSAPDHITAALTAVAKNKEVSMAE
ncbi:hypothetical protein THMIRHAS_07900 [Thiosulfatimonas sediminis]|uniref:Uncharacterized protein n=1 Tax=Thiosulfatimonas sediminis TaxID=2675054 RepID=A0A6F8PTQ8_9GAMM|nr:hypothetical protein [Thiosulfatimonas sediminis]BBP45417.1 hypothetical protein THMIRHAS_07900 [Thiosulfatimonas sediminis]